MRIEALQVLSSSMHNCTERVSFLSDSSVDGGIALLRLNNDEESISKNGLLRADELWTLQFMQSSLPWSTRKLCSDCCMR